MLEQELAQIFDSRSVVSRGGDHKAAHSLTEPLVGHTDDRERLQRRMVGEMLLDLPDADVHPAANDDVFGPARDPYVSVLGHHPQIAGLGKAVLGEQGRGFLRVGEIFDHVGLPAVGDVALGAARHLVAVEIDDFDLRARHRGAVGSQGP